MNQLHLETLLDNYNRAQNNLKRFRQEHFPTGTVIKHYKDGHDETLIVVGHFFSNPIGMICQNNNEQTCVVRIDAKIIVVTDVDNYPVWVKIALGL